ncbi:glycosyltransferase family 39 protein [Endozoicomonas montiporae]|uniref:UDP-phosphomannose:protein mannosyltransferase n=1 Tax=Endozoicomonas montiporae CL-33 TaxID=570277 RepID=A0A142BF40_9GAMM|nr:glycosyltransferase family 39 protein [Endozoicomonas montiporae]AMO57366.1 UDP-phosphomannose:protein mannosyltransferase [Endozoicomonas montiporae CL-33]
MDHPHPDANDTLKHPLRWLGLLCLFQITLWTLAPNWVRHTLNSDTLEGITWGNLWQWGYDKHPPLAAWITALFARLSETSDLPVYFLAQLSIVIVFIAVWRLAREYLPTHGALLAVFLLQGVLFYSNRIERVTPDTIQGPVWALLALTFYFAVTRESLKYWLLTGVLAGLAILAKYQAAVLFLPLLVVLFITKEGISNLKTAGPWLGGVVAALIALPHVHWLMENDFAAVGYLEDTYVNNPDIQSSSRFYYPLSFTINSFNNIIPLLLLCIPLYCARTQDSHYSAFKSRFLTAIALGPFVLTLLFGLVTGEKLIPRWATPYFAWLPLFLLVRLQPEIPYKRFKTLVVCCLALGLTFCALRTGYQYYKPLYKERFWESDEYMPAREEMAYAEKLWQKHHDYPMPYLGGLHYHIAELAAYSQYDPIPFFGLNPAESLWMDPADFRTKGGMILIRHGRKKTGEVQERLKSNYPEAIYIGSHNFKPVSRLDVEPPIEFTTDYYLLEPEPDKEMP